MKSKIKDSGSFPLIYILLIVLVVLIIVGVIAYIFYPRNISTNEDDEISCPKNHVCLPQKTFNKLANRTVEVISREKEKEIIIESRDIQRPSQSINLREGIELHEDAAISRDRKVLNDPLFPPLARTDRMTFDSVALETRKRNINIPMKDIGDTYRLVGYVTSQEGERDAGGNNWKLMAREKSRNESEFYMIPTNNNYDIKVPLTPEVCDGPRLRDLYSIPNQLRFKSPLLNRGTYEFVEIPKTQFTDPYYL